MTLGSLVDKLVHDIRSLDVILGVDVAVREESRVV